MLIDCALTAVGVGEAESNRQPGGQLTVNSTGPALLPGCFCQTKRYTHAPFSRLIKSGGKRYCSVIGSIAPRSTRSSRPKSFLSSSVDTSTEPSVLKPLNILSAGIA